MGYKVNESDLAYKLNYRYAMYKGYPIYLSAAGGNYGNSAYKMVGTKVGDSSGAQFNVDINEPTFSAAAIQAGYCFDVAGNLGFLKANAGQVETVWLDSTRGFDAPGTKSPKLFDCFMNKHPTFREAVAKVTGTSRKRACSFDRNFAFARDGSFSDIDIHYKGRPIGYYDAKTDRVKLRNGPTVKLLKRKLDKLME